MDRVTESLLTSFSKENSLDHLDEAKSFEHFTAFSMIRRHYSRSFSTDDVVLGGGGDTGIDAIAIILNNVLVTDADKVRELAEQNDYLEPVFIFVQAERSSSFDGQKIGNFGFGATDFFSKTPRLPRSVEIHDLVEITDVVLGDYAHILRPARCHLYYVTSGQWQNDAHLVGRRDSVVSDIRSLAIFDSVDMMCAGAAELQATYRKTKSPISRRFLFDRHVQIPATEGITQALLGYVPFSEFRKPLTDESGSEMLTSIFEDNIRDWQGYKSVNTEIRDTLTSDHKSKFVLMNNGVTIIARGLSNIGNLYTLTDYQIVNGCQSSNVLFGQRENVDDSVQVPLRLIHTTDAKIKELITTATNRQTDIKPDQFASSREFARSLELFFSTYPDEHRLYYERRDGQYDRGPEPKLRVVDTPTILRSYASIFREVPHAVTRSYRSIRDEIGESIFTEGDKQVAYYYAAYSWFTLESLFRSRSIDPAFKSGRYHLLLAYHLLIDSTPSPARNSRAMERRAEHCLESLFDIDKAEALFAKAAALLQEVTGGNLDRDRVRTEAVTDAIVAKLRPPH